MERIPEKPPSQPPSASSGRYRCSSLGVSIIRNWPRVRLLPGVVPVAQNRLLTFLSLDGAKCRPEMEEAIVAKTLSLEAELLRVFRLALAEERNDVGELLLQSLELMCDRESKALCAAYGDIEVPPRRLRASTGRVPGTRRKLIM